MIYAIKTFGTENDELVQPRIFEDLKNGKARFGWSFQNSADLREIYKILEDKNWEYGKIDEKRMRFWSMGGFLLDIRRGDYLVYINLPEKGQCAVVQATEEYSFDEGIYCDDFRSYAENSRDFRHYIPVNFVNTFLRKGQYVHPYLQRRLVLQGRWWRIYAEQEFQDLWKSLEHAVETKENTFEFTLKLLEEEIKADLKNINNKILHTFPNKSLRQILKQVEN
jgi:hypothetical protein